MGRERSRVQREREGLHQWVRDMLSVLSGMVAAGSSKEKTTRVIRPHKWKKNHWYFQSTQSPTLGRKVTISYTIYFSFEDLLIQQPQPTLLFSQGCGVCIFGWLGFAAEAFIMESILIQGICSSLVKIVHFNSNRCIKKKEYVLNSHSVST